MSVADKNSLLSRYEKVNYLEIADYIFLNQLADDEDSYIRSSIACMLVDFVTSQSKNILLKLANDCDAIVRMQAYDSLSAFPFLDVEEKLRNALQNECDDLARSYVIMSYVDISAALHFDNSLCYRMLQNSLVTEKSEICILSIYYALYKLGDDTMLDKMLSLLHNESYHIRCASIKRLYEITTVSNMEEIRQAMVQLLKEEKVPAVICCAEKYMKEMVGAQEGDTGDDSFHS